MTRTPTDPPLSPEKFKAKLEALGWDYASLAERWGMTERRIYQIIADPERNRYYEDTLTGLPKLKKRLDRLKDLTPGEQLLLKRLSKGPIEMVYKRAGWRACRLPRHCTIDDVERLRARKPSVVQIELGSLRLIT